jgi:hypothetical protein
MVFVMIPLAVSFLFVWTRWGKYDAAFWLGIGSFVGGILYWAWQDYRLFRSYRCPKCGLHIEQPTIRERKEGDPICFFCPSCDITWDTTLKQ